MKDRVTVGLVATLVLLVVIDVLFVKHHDPVFTWHYVPGYMALIGFISCVVVAVLSKSLGKWFLQEPEEKRRD